MAYANRLIVEQREYAEKQYKSHRRAGRDAFVYFLKVVIQYHSRASLTRQVSVPR
jgi:hypothetical protein